MLNSTQLFAMYIIYGIILASIIPLAFITLKNMAKTIKMMKNSDDERDE